MPERASLTARLFQLFDATLVAATFQPTGFLQLDLASPETELPLIVNFTTSLSGSINIKFQLGASGAAGPVAESRACDHLRQHADVFGFTEPKDGGPDLHEIEPFTNE